MASTPPVPADHQQLSPLGIREKGEWVRDIGVIWGLPGNNGKERGN